MKEAKIRAIQIQSLKKVENGKKRPLQEDIPFSLGDSQYSTFEARAEGRKKEKKVKKPKQKLPEPSLMETRKTAKSKASSGKTGKHSRGDVQKTVPRSKVE